MRRLRRRWPPLPLDAMMLRGLNDHLQGGISATVLTAIGRYPILRRCFMTRPWLLWCYSLGYRVTQKEEYRRMAEKILRCLDESFELDGLYISAFNADTGHEEGVTYLWDSKELESELGPEDFKKFCQVL